MSADKKSAGMLQPKKQSLSRAALGTESFDFYRFKPSSIIKSGILALFKKNRWRQRALKYLQLTDMYNFIREIAQAEQQLCNM